MLLRSLPVLLLVLLACGMAGSQRATAVTHAVIGYTPVAADAPSEFCEAVATSTADAEPAPADRTSVLTTKYTAGPRGCRAPPAVRL